MVQKKTNAIISYEQFDRENKSGLFGAFLFFGEEDYLKERTLSKLREQVMSAEGFELFNLFDISFSGASGKTHDELFAALSDALDAMPMMQEQKFIEIHDLAIDKMAASEADALASACEKAGADTVMIIFCRDSELVCDYRFEQGTNFKKLAAAATPVRFFPMTKPRLCAFAKKTLAAEKISITDGAADLLCDMCACRMMALTGEISKIIAYANTLDGEKVIDDKTVKEICSVSAGDEVPFLLSDAMQKWSATAMFDALRQSKDMREEPIAVVAKMGRTYTDMLMIKTAMTAGLSSAEISKQLKMNAWRADKYVQSLGRVPIEIIERAITKLYELDLKLKSTQSDAWMLVDLFVCDVYMPRSMR